MLLPPGLDQNAPSLPRPRGRPSGLILSRLIDWSLRWISFIVARIPEQRREEAALLLAAAALAVSEGLSGAAAHARALVWHSSFRGGHVADLRGQGDGGWSLADGTQLPGDGDP